MLIDVIKERFKENTYISTKELIDADVSKSSISYLVSTGQIRRISRGIYSINDKFDDTMYLLHCKYKMAVFSHESALYIHDLTDQVPEIYDLTVARNYKVNPTKEFKIKFKYVDKKVLNLGVEMKDTGMGNKVPVYNVERTICDIIRSDSKIESYVVNNAIRKYMLSAKLSKLMIYAKKMNIENKVKKKLEVLL